MLFSASYYLHSPSTESGARYRRITCIDMDVLRGCGLLRRGLNFSTAWCTTRQVSVEKDWKHVLMQKMVTLNTCCNIACLTFQLPRRFFSEPPRTNHNWLFSEPPTSERTQRTRSNHSSVTVFVISFWYTTLVCIRH